MSSSSSSTPSTLVDPMATFMKYPIKIPIAVSNYHGGALACDGKQQLMLHINEDKSVLIEEPISRKFLTVEGNGSLSWSGDSSTTFSRFELHHGRNSSFPYGIKSRYNGKFLNVDLVSFLKVQVYKFCADVHNDWESFRIVAV